MKRSENDIITFKNRHLQLVIWATALFSFFLFSDFVFAKSQVVEGKLDAKGAYEKNMDFNANAPFIIQAFVFYREKWRPVTFFWKDTSIFIDLGPEFKELVLRVHILSE